VSARPAFASKGSARADSLAVDSSPVGSAPIVASQTEVPQELLFSS